MRDKIFFPRPVTSVMFRGEIVPFDSPLAWIRFPGFNFLDVARFGLVSAYLRFTNPWRSLERETADEWMRRWYGEKIYNTTWRPLLIGKFGPYYRQANMAWMWARLKVRSPRLGYFRGGFQMFVDVLSHTVRRRGGQIRFRAPVEQITPSSGARLTVRAAGDEATYDKVLVTTSPALLSRMAPSLPSHYLEQLLKLKSMGAVVMTLALRRSLMNKTYWLNIPASAPDKQENEIPFLALVEHTNYIDRQHYGGDHIVYCGDYVTADHAYMHMSEDELKTLFVGSLRKINPGFDPSWVRKSWLFRAPYAQPVPEINHSHHIPPLRTPVSHLYFASMSQVYPWDRGTNFAVDIGRRAAAVMVQEGQTRS